jgi:hypothetical protein
MSKKAVKEKKTIKEKIKIKPKLESSRVLPHKIHGKNVHMTNFKLNLNDDNTNDTIEDFLNNIKKNLKGVSSYQIMVKFSSGKQYACGAWMSINNTFKIPDFNELYNDVGNIIELFFFLNM